MTDVEDFRAKVESAKLVDRYFGGTPAAGEAHNRETIAAEITNALADYEEQRALQSQLFMTRPKTFKTHAERFNTAAENLMKELVALGNLAPFWLGLKGAHRQDLAATLAEARDVVEPLLEAIADRLEEAARVLPSSRVRLPDHAAELTIQALVWLFQHWVDGCPDCGRNSGDGPRAMGRQRLAFVKDALSCIGGVTPNEQDIKRMIRRAVGGRCGVSWDPAKVGRKA